MARIERAEREREDRHRIPVAADEQSTLLKLPRALSAAAVLLLVVTACWPLLGGWLSGDRPGDEIVFGPSSARQGVVVPFGADNATYAGLDPLAQVRSIANRVFGGYTELPVLERSGDEDDAARSMLVDRAPRVWAIIRSDRVEFVWGTREQVLARAGRDVLITPVRVVRVERTGRAGVGGSDRSAPAPGIDRSRWTMPLDASLY